MEFFFQAASDIKDAYSKAKESIKERKERRLIEIQENIERFQAEELLRSEKKKIEETVEIKRNKVSIENFDCLLCPISQDIMTDPVLSPYGHCFQRSEIERWLLRKPICPLTGKPLTIAQLVPCLTVRRIVSELQAKNS